MNKENDNKELTENKDIFKSCPYCSEKILLNAIKCKYCGEWLNKKEKKEKRKKKIGKMFLNFFLCFIIYFVTSAIIKAIFFSENPDVTGKMFVIDILVILTVTAGFFIVKKAKKNDKYYSLLILLLFIVTCVFIFIIIKWQAISFKINTSMVKSDEGYEWLSCGDNFYDRRNGEVYSTIAVGDQCWFQKNLNIGSKIDGEGYGHQAENSKIEKYCYDNNIDNCDIYGGLYDWDESMDYSLNGGSKGICPDGWHIPTNNEWRVLIDYLGSEAGSKLAGEYDLWDDGSLRKSSNFGSSNFLALPAGRFLPQHIGKTMVSFRSSAFSSLGQYSYFWSSSFKYYCSIRSGDTVIECKELDAFGNYSFSIRCLKDE